MLLLWQKQLKTVRSYSPHSVPGNDPLLLPVAGMLEEIVDINYNYCLFVICHKSSTLNQILSLQYTVSSGAFQGSGLFVCCF